MRTYICPIGFNSTSVTRPILSRGIDTGDEVVLLRPANETEPQAKEALDDVERLLREIEPDVSLTTERISHTEFSTAVLECSDIIRAATGERIVTLGGGARDILVPFVVAAITHVRLLDAALFFSDIDGTVSEWRLPRLTATVPETVRRTLETIADAEDAVSVPALTDRTGQSKSTVTRHVAQLADEGVVETWKDGKTKYARITLTGTLLLREQE
jgi:CRISPR-associated protein Csa3